MHNEWKMYFVVSYLLDILHPNQLYFLEVFKVLNEEKCLHPTRITGYCHSIHAFCLQFIVNETAPKKSPLSVLLITSQIGDFVLLFVFFMFTNVD